MSLSGNLSQKHAADLTKGNVTRSMVQFALPFILGNLFQQFYNIADTMIVGRLLGTNELAAVGSAYTLMTFITSVILGLCMGSGVIFSHLVGAGQDSRLRKSIYISFTAIGMFSLVLNIAVLTFVSPILELLQIPEEIFGIMKDYTFTVMTGIMFTFVYNFYAFLLRSVGNSTIPLVFLSTSVLLNIALDLLFIITFGMGIKGAAAATVLSQAVAAAGIAIWTMRKFPELMPRKSERKFNRKIFKDILSYSTLTCAQQSVMNFGILMVQGLVNSFGTAVMAAFSAAVKIDTFAYMPVQDFGNAFSTFIAQNFGAGKKERIRKAIRSASVITVVFSASVSALVIIFSRQLMMIFVNPEEHEVIRIGMEYLYIEGSFYIGIGVLFLLYGLFRAVGQPEVSLVLTIISLGLRVVLAYILSAFPFFGVRGIWWAIPIGWIIADVTGIIWYRNIKHK